MVWILAVSVCVGLSVWTYFATRSIYGMSRWVVMFAVTVFYTVLCFKGYVCAVTEDCVTTVVVEGKRREEVEKTEKWSTVCNYVKCSDGLEYWVPYRVWASLQVGESTEVEYILYEGKIKKYKHKEGISWK